MKVFRHISALTAWRESLSKNAKVGFVPTMGALHEGHESLMRACKEGSEVSVLSIFVNPTQFNDPEDFRKYPTTPDLDLEMAYRSGMEVVFMPEAHEIYAEDVQAFDFGALEQVMEGKERPGHFRGVGQIVNKLLDLVKPHQLYMGQKDFQQCAIIASLLQQTRKTETELKICPTVREASGLAMSSRNRRLTEEALKNAAYLSEILFKLEKLENRSLLFEQLYGAKAAINAIPGVELEYLEVADRHDLQQPRPDSKLVICAAIWIEGVRLIDNVLPNY